MSKVTLESLDGKLNVFDLKLQALSDHLLSFQKAVEVRFDSVDLRLDGHDAQFVAVLGKLSEHNQALSAIQVKLTEHDDLLHLIADTVSRHDDDLTYLKRTLRHQRV